MPRALCLLALTVLLSMRLSAAPPAPAVPTQWEPPVSGEAKGEKLSSQTRAGETLTVLYDAIVISLQGETKALSAIRASTLSATYVPRAGQKVKGCSVQIRGSAHTAAGGRMHLVVTSGEITKTFRLSRNEVGKANFEYRLAIPFVKVGGGGETSSLRVAVSLALIAERPTEGIPILCSVESLDLAAVSR